LKTNIKNIMSLLAKICRRYRSRSRSAGKRRKSVCHSQSASRPVRGSRTKKGRACFVSRKRRSAGLAGARKRRRSRK
jgi:hypothetical protein